MRLFHISDVLTATTGRLVSNRHMEGVYEVLNFLTGDNLYTHQLPRAMEETRPWLEAQYPALMRNAVAMQAPLEHLDTRVQVLGSDTESLNAAIKDWVEEVRRAHGLPEMLPLHPMGADMHTHMDPIEEAQAMFGDKKIIVVRAD